MVCLFHLTGQSVENEVPHIRLTRTAANTTAISDGILTLRFGLGRGLRTLILDLFTTL